MSCFIVWTVAWMLYLVLVPSLPDASDRRGQSILLTAGDNACQG